MTMRSPVVAATVAAIALLGTALPAAAQYAPDGYDSTYGFGGQGGYDVDGQSVDSVAVFYEPLARYGRWADSRYGRVWKPAVPRDWRPYTLGHWEQGRYGLTWRSDEPFGWAAYHFGRWAFDRSLGWVWAPDTVWGPGWVAWRDSDEVAGWAPLPPQISINFAFGSGFGFNDWGYDRWYAPAWSYVPRSYLYSRSLRGAYLPFARNRDWWERTRGVTRYERVDGRIVDRSFGRERDGGDWRGGDGRGYDPRDPRRTGIDPRAFGRDRRDTDPRTGFDPRNGAGMRTYDPRGGNPQVGNPQPGNTQPGFDPRVRTDPRLGGDPRGYRRDDRRVDPAAPPLYGTAPRAVPPPAGYAVPDGGRPRGFGGRDGPGGRDGFVPGTPPRQFERAAPPMAVAPVPAFRPSPAPLPAPAPAMPMARPMTPPPAANPPPAPEPRGDARTQGRERNADERPR